MNSHKAGRKRYSGGTSNTRRLCMKLLIEARFENSDGVSGPPIVVGEIERHDGNLADLGLTLAQGRERVIQTVGGHAGG